MNDPLDNVKEEKKTICSCGVGDEGTAELRRVLVASAVTRVIPPPAQLVLGIGMLEALKHKADCLWQRTMADLCFIVYGAITAMVEQAAQEIATREADAEAEDPLARIPEGEVFN